MNEQGHFRASPRPQLTVEVRIVRKWSIRSDPVVARTQDVGTGGLFAVTSAPMDSGERVRVVLETPTSWEPLTLDAEVAWRREAGGEDAPEGVGLRFVDLSEEQRAALARLVSSLDYEG